MDQTTEQAKKIIDLCQLGLSRGLGKPEPGGMCVEAVVCFALGLPHGDNPRCVGDEVRHFKIKLNDSFWSSYLQRGQGMMRLALAQLGSDQISQKQFSALVCRGTIQKVLPLLFSDAAEKLGEPHRSRLLEAGERCQNSPVAGTADHAAFTAYSIAKVAYEAKVLTDPVAAATVSRYATIVGSAASEAAMATYNAASSATAASFGSVHLGDSILRLSASIALEALKELGSPGCQFLYLCDEMTNQ